MKLLFISRDLPIEGSGGTSVYRLSILKYIKIKGWNIDYLLLHYKGENNQDINKRFIEFNSLMKIIRMPTDSQAQFPVWSALSNKYEIRFVDQQIKLLKPDLVIADHPWLGSLFKNNAKDKNYTTAILTHDVQFQKIREFKKFGINPYKRNGDFNQPKWSKMHEKSALSKADIVLAIQKDDLVTFKQLLPLKKIEYLPMAAEIRKKIRVKQIEGRCLFVGGSAQHNIYAISWFLSKVWPIVIKLDPSASLHICGGVCTGLQKENFMMESVTFKNQVPNVDYEYSQAQVCLIPLPVGSGLKIKLVEALSYGKACVSTRAGVQGICDVENYGVIVADKEEDFAKSIVSIINNPNKRKMFEVMNKQYALTHLSTDVAYGHFILGIYKLKKNT